MTRWFFTVMAVSSALSLLRGFIVASALTLSDFGLYASLVALGAFSSSLLGMGRIEGTMKTFPRAWAAGGALSMCYEADVLARAVAFRAVGVAAAGALALLTAGRSAWVVMALLATGVALGTAAMGIYASAVRATCDLRALGRATFLRSALALVLCWLGACLGGWPGAMLGEVSAAAIGALWARREARLLTSSRIESSNNDVVEDLEPDNPAAGRWLLMAMLAASVPLYLDRLFVAGTLGSEAAGQYAFMMLFITGAVTVAGIVVQKVGPGLVHAQHAGASVREQWGTVQTWMLGQAALLIVGMCAAAALILYGPLDSLGQRYRLDVQIFAAVAALGSLQGNVLLDWLLLSRDQERCVFIAACVYLLAVLLLAAWLSLAIPTLLQIIIGLTAAKLAHVAVQGVLIAMLTCSPKRGASA